MEEQESIVAKNRLKISQLFQDILARDQPPASVPRSLSRVQSSQSNLSVISSHSSHSQSSQSSQPKDSAKRLAGDVAPRITDLTEIASSSSTFPLMPSGPAGHVQSFGAGRLMGMQDTSKQLRDPSLSSRVSGEKKASSHVNVRNNNQEDCSRQVLEILRNDVVNRRNFTAGHLLVLSLVLALIAPRVPSEPCRQLG